MMRIIFAIVVAAGVMFSLAGLFTGVIVRDFIASNVDQAVMRAPPNLLLVFAGYLFLAFLMTVLYRKLVRVTGSPAWSGLRFGLVAGVCWLMPYSLVLFGVYKFPYAALPLDFAWALVEQGIGGLAIGLVLGRTKTTF
jgi:hypothetical protein